MRQNITRLKIEARGRLHAVPDEKAGCFSKVRNDAIGTLLRSRHRNNLGR